MKKINWNNLNNYKCPRCGGELSEINTLHSCLDCTFFIKNKTLKDILSGSHKKKGSISYDEPDRSGWE